MKTKAPRKTASRARGPSATTEQRIEHIMGLMRTLKFRTGVTAEELSTEWGLGIRRVYELTAEASKRVRAEINDPDHVSAHVGVALMTALDDEMAKRPTKRSGKAVAELAKTWATISGAGAPTKHEVTGPNGAPVVDVKAAQDDLLGRIARLAAEGGAGADRPKPDSGGSPAT